MAKETKDVRSAASAAAESTQPASPRRLTQTIGAENAWARAFAPSRISGRRAVFVALETIIATLLTIAVCRLVDRNDPLLIGTGFGWVWIVPIVLTLRYGTIVGVGSGLLLVLAWYELNGGLGVTSGRHALHFPVSFFFGGFIFVLICGQFGDIWIGRQRQARVANDYLAERLSILTKNQFLLRLSHERLEQDLLGKHATLRDSLGRLRTLALKDDEPGLLKGVGRFLETAGQACQLGTAAIYEWRDGRLMTSPAASVGAPFELDVNDPLVVEALDKGVLAHPQAPDRPDESKTRYLVCAPLLDAGREPVGLLVVQHMPFLALTRDNLQFLLVLCGYYADGVRHAHVTRALTEAFPRCPYDFALDYGRLVHLYRDTRIASSLVALVFDASETGNALFAHVLRSRRALDVQWSLRAGEQRVVLTLMPLAGENAVDGYLLRIEENLRARFGVDFEAAQMATYALRVGPDEPIEALHGFLRLCHVET